MRITYARRDISLKYWWIMMFLFFLNISGKAAAQLPPPINDSPLKYSSPFGPRANKGLYQFHHGVDYRYPVSTAILAVEGGTITAIDTDSLDDWYVSVQGATGRFSYLHLF